MRRALRIALLCGATLASACLATSAERQAEQDLGPEEPGIERGPYHRPGQPCLVCHGEDHNPGDLVYELAGTIFRRPGDTRGVGDVAVVISDAGGHQYRALSNAAGNFFLTLHTNLKQPRLAGRDGELQIPRKLEYPLRVRIKRGADEQQMQGQIGREGNCAHCHQRELGRTSNGYIYLQPQAVP